MWRWVVSLCPLADAENATLYAGVYGGLGNQLYGLLSIAALRRATHLDVKVFVDKRGKSAKLDQVCEEPWEGAYRLFRSSCSFVLVL